MGTALQPGLFGQNAVMAGRVKPRTEGLDDFPTPPWGTRALYRYVLPQLGYPAHAVKRLTAWEPACNRGLMCEVMTEFHENVFASDVIDYGFCYTVGSFIGVGPDVAVHPFDGKVGIVATNPPFRLAAEFAERAFAEAGHVVALLLRTQWIETEERYELFQRFPLTAMAPFAGRLAMIEGRWNPEGGTATSYSWFVWCLHHRARDRPIIIQIPPDARRHCTMPDDVRRFAWRGAPVAEGVLL